MDFYDEDSEEKKEWRMGFFVGIKEKLNIYFTPKKKEEKKRKPE